MPIKHAKQSGLPADEGKPAHVEPTDWYADHIGSNGGLSIYGDGHLGNPVFDGVNTFTFADLVGSSYTLNQTLYAGDVTVDVGVTLDAAGWPLYARGTFTNNGTVTNATTGNYDALIPGGTGGGGGNGFEPGANGNGFYRASTTGTGGAGGAAGANAGGNPADPDPWWNMQRSSLGGGSLTPHIFDVFGLGVQLRAPFAGGNGGGGGGANGGGGGNGGRGGMVVLLAARHLVNNGSIIALGVNGGNATLNTYDAWAALHAYTAGDRVQPTTHIYEAQGNGTSGAAAPTWTDNGADVVDGTVTWTDKGAQAAGGGGGGQGGYLIFFYDDFSGSLPVAATACAGGAAGTGAGAGSNGTAGDPGHVITIPNA